MVSAKQPSAVTFLRDIALGRRFKSDKQKVTFLHSFFSFTGFQITMHFLWVSQCFIFFARCWFASKYDGTFFVLNRSLYKS